MKTTQTTGTLPATSPRSTALGRPAHVAAIVAAVLGVPSDLYHFTIDSRAAEVETTLFKLHGIGLVVALSLLLVLLVPWLLRVAQQTGQVGRLASTGAVLAYAGGVLVIGNVSTEAFMMRLAPEPLSDPTGYSLAVIVVSFGSWSLGWFLLALAAGRAGVISPPLTLLMCLGALYAFTPMPGSYTVLLLAVALSAPALRRLSD